MAKAKPESKEIESDDQPVSKARVILQSDLTVAFNAAKDKESALSALALFDEYKAIAGGLKPGNQKQYNDLRRLAK